MHKRILIAFLITICVAANACSKPSIPPAVSAGSSSSISSLSGVSVSESSAPLPPPEAPVLLPNPIVKTQSGVEISVQPQIELLAVMQYLSNYDDVFGLITKFDLSYKRDIDAYFSAFKGHEAISFLNEYVEIGYSFDLPPTDAMMMNQDFSLDKTAYSAAEFLREQRTTLDINELIGMMKSFYIDTDFASFFLAHIDYYQAIIDNTAAVFPDWDMTGTMELFYGKTMSSYNLVLSSLYHPGGFGPGIERESGLAVYSIQGPLDVVDGLPVFGSAESFTRLALHEFGHSFIPIAGTTDGGEAIWNALDESEYLMEPIRERMEKSAYPQWPTACEELVLRAAVIRMVENDSLSTVEEFIQNEYDDGFIYIQAAYDSLQKYIEDRETYPVFDSYIPVLIQDVMSAHPQAR